MLTVSQSSKHTLNHLISSSGPQVIIILVKTVQVEFLHEIITRNYEFQALL